MKLYNQSSKKDGRALILDPKKVIKGGSFLAHDHMKERKYFNPRDTIEVEEAYGKMLLKMYPDMVMRTDEKEDDDEPVAKKKKIIKKAAKKVAKKTVKKAKKR